MSETRVVKGYKVFAPDWACRPYGNHKQYTCPGKFEEDIAPIQCMCGMHFCKSAVDCFNYYSFNPENKVAEVIAYGDIVEQGDKCCTDKLEIVREIPWDELLGIVNIGRNCTGLGNSGNHNSGNYNSGNYNSGNYNSGDCNSGDCNSGNYNSGHRNSGHHNGGNRNSGHHNSGNYNSGNYNSGDWNDTSNAVGCFNIKKQKLKFFDKETDITYEEWQNSKAKHILNQINFSAVSWISENDMTDKEKAQHPEHGTTGGYLRTLNHSECAVLWWLGLSELQKEIITAIPNFDKVIFKEVTGIDVDKD